MDIQQDVSLKNYNSLAVDVRASYFVKVNDASDIPEVIQFASIKQLPVLILGGGSNIVLTKDFKGLAVHLKTSGITINDCGDHVEVVVAAGENWHHFVLRCLAQGCYGLENLSLIPGSVGAAPIQNIGAYGVELKDIFSHLRGWNIKDKAWQVLDKNQCKFSYRDSVFKHELKDQFIITEINMKLSKVPRAQLSYQALDDYFVQANVDIPTPYQVAEAVIAIRSKKLPSPDIMPNAGSFFKNPIVSERKFSDLLQQYPDIVHYPQANNEQKLAAGWMLEKAGWKGRSIGHIAMHTQQALVLVNCGGTGKQIKEFADTVKADIQDKFSVSLEIEPRLY